MLQEANTGKSSDIKQPPLVFSKSEVTPLGIIANPRKEEPEKEESAKKENGDNKAVNSQKPVTFSKTEEVIPLGFSNKLLRKIAWAGGVASFLLTGASGLKFKNPARTASGLGSAGITFFSMVMPEKDEPLPDTSIPKQMGHALLHPTENTMFFNRSATIITDALKLVAGIQGGRNQEMLEAGIKVGMKSVDIAGVSDQDRREKLAVQARINGTEPPKEHRGFLSTISHSRWTWVAGSMMAAATQVQQGKQHNDKNILRSGLLYFLNVGCLAADNAIMEYNIRKMASGKENTSNDRGR